MEKIICLIVVSLSIGNTYGSDHLFRDNDFISFFRSGENNLQIQSIEQNDAMIKKGYYPFMLYDREPMIIYVNKSRWNAKINNFKEYIAESRKKELVYGVIQKKDDHYYAAAYLKSTFDLKIKYKYKNKDDEEKFLDEIDVIVAGISYSKKSKLKPIASLSNKRYQVIKYNFPLRRSVEFIAPTIGETDKKGVEYTVPYLIYLRENISPKEKKEIEDKIKVAALSSDHRSEHIFGNDLTKYIKNYKQRKLSLEN